MFLLLLLFGGAILFCVYGVADFFLLRNVRRAEKMEVSLQLERVRRLFDAEAASLSGFVEDWSAWDDTCQFLTDTNRAYIKSNLPDEFFAKNRIHLVLFADKQGAIVYGRHLNKNSASTSHLFGGGLAGHSDFSWLLGLISVTNGVIILPGGPAVMAAAPILNSQYLGPRQGVLVMARYIDPLEQNRLSHLYGVSFHFCENFARNLGSMACRGCCTEEDVPIRISSINAAAPVVFGVRVPYTVLHANVVSDRYLMMGSLLVLCVLICSCAALVVEQSVLKRLNKLSEFVRTIKPNEVRKDRLNVGGADELTLLAGVVNRMLDDMQRAQGLEKAVRQAQKIEAVGNLAVGIAHDFNNMLYVIRGYTTMLTQRIQGDAAACEYLEKIVKAVDQSSNLVKQLMVFGRRDEQGVCRFSLASIVKESMTLFRAMVPGAIEVRKHLKEERDVILADPAQIYQMVMNLYLNAYHAMREKGGVLTITTEMRRPEAGREINLPADPGAKWICLSVADTGCGILDRDVERVFDPYFTTKPIGEGSGLGLSVVHHIVESAGGYVQVTSKAGSGSVFSVYLPLVAGEAAEVYQPSASQVERSHESSSIPNT